MARWGWAGSVAFVGLATLAGCGGGVRRFPLADAVWVDEDLRPVSVPCTTVEDDGEVETVCRPEEYVSPFAWDVADKTVFRPLTQFFAADVGFEAKNVNALDEVPDSSWFTNRIGLRPFTPADLVRGSCGDTPIDPRGAKPGSWVVDMGKPNGANPGFRVNIEGVGKFMLKADVAAEKEKATGATAIASRLYHAAGWWTVCDTVVYFPRDLLSLKPGLRFADNSGIEREFDEAALMNVLDGAQKRDGLVRMVASSWLPGRTIGPFRYEDTRPDDPNDVVPHEDRRDLRGARVIAAWLAHYDSREQNSMTTWLALDPKKKDTSPGHTLHWYIDLGDCFGSKWAFEPMTRRLNHSYYLDVADVGIDLFTLGIAKRPYDAPQLTPGAEMFNYFTADDFDPEAWKGGYPNPAFARMTEADGAWAARIITRFDDELVATAVKVGDYTDPFHTEWLTKTLIRRRDAIRRAYFDELSPLADVYVRGRELCATDLAQASGTFPEQRYYHSAVAWHGVELEHRVAIPVRAVRERDGGRLGDVCLTLPPSRAAASMPPDHPARYLVVDVENAVSEGPLRAHLYDLGDAGARLVGLERPADRSPTW